jgi:hypothetical protein
LTLAVGQYVQDHHRYPGENWHVDSAHTPNQRCPRSYNTPLPARSERDNNHSFPSPEDGDLQTGVGSTASIPFRLCDQSVSQATASPLTKKRFPPR